MEYVSLKILGLLDISVSAEENNQVFGVVRYDKINIKSSNAECVESVRGQVLEGFRYASGVVRSRGRIAFKLEHLVVDKKLSSENTVDVISTVSAAVAIKLFKPNAEELGVMLGELGKHGEVVFY